MGAEYNGLKSLFLNILSMLSIVELGFGSAIVYNLYQPLVEKNEKVIKAVVSYYKKIYNYIAIIILSFGLILTFIIPLLVGKTNIKENIYIIYILYLLNSVATYIYSYKRSILYADQKNYIINIIDLIFNFFRNVFQICILLFYKNIYLYLIVQIIFTLFNNIMITKYVNKEYVYLSKLNKRDNLDKDLKKNILQKVKGLMFHKIGGFFVTGTDNILISLSKDLGVIYVGYYANYNMIIANVSLIFSMIINSATASVGNLLASKSSDYKKRISTYRSIVLVNSWIYCFGMICIYNLMEPFIKLWLGNEFLLSPFVLLILVINFYINGIKFSTNIFKEAAGIFYEDRFVPLIESFVNIIFSIIFMKIYGLAGIFMGTICSSLVLLLFSYPKYVYKNVFNDNIKNYFKLQFFYFCISFLTFFIVIFITNLVKVDSLISELIIKTTISLILTNLLYFIFVIKSKDFKYLKKLIFKR